MARRKNAGHRNADTVADARDRKERFEEYVDEYSRANSTGRVKAIGKGFSARVVRKGDGPQDVRDCESVAPGDVVEIPIDRDSNSPQRAEVVAWLRAKDCFEPTKDDLTDPPEDDRYHGTLSTADVLAKRHAAAIAAGEADDEVITIKRADMQAMLAAAVKQGVEAATAKAAA